jgi:pimeloyl-ACP methyl ester carboxylesterase
VRGLSVRHTVAVFDNRGIGNSTLPTGGGTLTVEDMADDAQALADHLGFDRFHVVGHSLGGVIAQRLALRAPARVKSIALLNTFADGREAAGLRPRLMSLGLRTRVGTAAMRRQAFLELIFPRAHLDTVVDKAALLDELRVLFGRDLSVSPPILNAQLRALTMHRCSAELSALASMPALVLGGAHDPISTPASSHRLHALLKGSRVVVFDDASHALPIQKFADVNALLLEHAAAAS